MVYDNLNFVVPQRVKADYWPLQNYLSRVLLFIMDSILYFEIQF